jgi:hypothetical protein
LFKVKSMSVIGSPGIPSSVTYTNPSTGVKLTANRINIDPSKAVGIKFTKAELDEIKLNEIQTRAREEANQRYAEQHPDKVYAQVVVNGKPFATAYDSGVTETPYQMLGMPNDGFGPGLAEARLAYIAKAVGGKIIHSNFFPVAGGSSRGAPDSVLPRVTARGLGEILQDNRMRAQVDAEVRNLLANGNEKT